MNLVSHDAAQVPRDELRSLLAHAVWPPTADRAGVVLQETYGRPGVTLYLMMEGRDVLGLIGLRRTGGDSGEITHIAVDPRRRLHGVGQHMVAEVRRIESLRILVAETDSDAVGFYRRCGFEVAHLGEKYPGVDRFLCTYREPEA